MPRWRWPAASVRPYRRFAADVLLALNSRPAEVAAWSEMRPLLPAAERDDPGALLRAFTAAANRIQRTLGFAPYETQLMAARAMLDGHLVELATGEGKTVATALAAAVAASSGLSVHVITANDYLVARDERQMRAFFQSLGLRSAAVTQPMEQAARRRAYGCAVVYCTAKELAFDFLRDRLLRPDDESALQKRARRLVRGDGAGDAEVLGALDMALVDEADTILIDEARVPLVLSSAAGSTHSTAFLVEALQRARALEEGLHFRRVAGTVRLTDEGRSRLAGEWTHAASALEAHPRHREQTVEQALIALHVLRRDRDYVLRDGAVTMVDETTGRPAAGRAWSRGLHQLVELKEGCVPTPQAATAVQTTFQRFFPRYGRLGGLSGTLRGATWELARIYGVSTVVVPPRWRPQVRTTGVRLWPDDKGLWEHVARQISVLRENHRPVLVGTGSVGDSEALSAVLASHRIPHRVLNAKQDSEESEIVVLAGDARQITVATSMAGRGTDIALGEGVAAAGGLHVILAQHNASRRIDRQFLGRCARRGEPGSTETCLSLEFPLFARWLPRWWRRMAAKPGISGPIAWLTARVPQGFEGYIQRRQRESLCRLTHEEERELMFGRKVPR